MTQTHYRVLMGVMMLTLFISLIFTAARLFEKSPIEFTNEPFPITEERIYKPGDTIAFIRNRCASRPVQYTLTQTFVREGIDETRSHSVSLESQEVTVARGGCETVTPIQRTVPEVLASGTYHMEFGVSVKGRFRDFVFVQKSVAFEVVNDDESEDQTIEQLIERVETRPSEPELIYVPVIQKETVTENTETHTESTHTETIHEPAEKGDNGDTEPAPEEPEREPLIPAIINSIL